VVEPHHVPAHLEQRFEHSLVIHEVAMNAGDLVIFTEALTHCTLPWRALGPRRTLLYKYAPGHMTWGMNYLSDLRELAISGLLTPRQTALVAPPSVYPRQSLRDLS
jgi:hypothetical protein